MASFREKFYPIIDNIRAITGPSGFDIRMNRLSIRVITWSGNRVGQGTATTETLDLPQRYPIRYLAQHEVATSGGRYELGDVMVDHITPSTSGTTGGYTPEQLSPRFSANNVEVQHVVEGSHAGVYRVVELKTLRPFTYQLVLRRTTKTP